MAQILAVIAHLNEWSPDLAQVLERWPALPENVNAAILDLVETAARQR